MALIHQQTDWHSGVLSLLHLFTLGNLVSILRNVLTVWDLARQVRDKIYYHGLYEIINYEATLEIEEPTGAEATLTRHEVIRFLQDNVVAIHDYAWGDGDQFADYQCQPGVPVDFYQDGSRHNVLMSLRETKNRGDGLDLWIERKIKDGFFEAGRMARNRDRLLDEASEVVHYISGGEALSEGNRHATKQQ